MLLAPNHPEILEKIKLIAAGEGDDQDDVASGKPDWTPLHYSVNSNRSERDFLVSLQARAALGADLDAQTDAGDTCLHLAAWNARASRLSAFLALGAAPDIPNLKGNTPLHQALRKKHLDMALDLTRAGADWLKLDRKGQCAVNFFDALGPLTKSQEASALWTHVLGLPPSAWEPCMPAFSRLSAPRQAALREAWFSRSLPSASASPSGKRRL